MYFFPTDSANTSAVVHVVVRMFLSLSLSISLSLFPLFSQSQNTVYSRYKSHMQTSWKEHTFRIRTLLSSLFPHCFLPSEVHPSVRPSFLSLPPLRSGPSRSASRSAPQTNEHGRKRTNERAVNLTFAAARRTMEQGVTKEIPQSYVHLYRNAYVRAQGIEARHCNSLFTPPLICYSFRMEQEEMAL